MKKLRWQLLIVLLAIVAIGTGIRVTRGTPFGEERGPGDGAAVTERDGPEGDILGAAQLKLECLHGDQLALDRLPKVAEFRVTIGIEREVLTDRSGGEVDRLPYRNVDRADPEVSGPLA